MVETVLAHRQSKCGQNCGEFDSLTEKLPQNLAKTCLIVEK
jgi:hypothetical protein